MSMLSSFFHRTTGVRLSEIAPQAVSMVPVVGTPASIALKIAQKKPTLPALPSPSSSVIGTAGQVIGAAAHLVGRKGKGLGLPHKRRGRGFSSRDIRQTRRLMRLLDRFNMEFAGKPAHKRTHRGMSCH